MTTVSEEAVKAAHEAARVRDIRDERSMRERVVDALTAALPFLPMQGAQLSPKDRNTAEIGGLVDTLRSMSHDDNTRACVSVNITASNDLAKKLFDVLHAAPKAATAIEAQAAELADATRRAERALAFIATLEAQLAEARKALGMMLREHDILSGNFGDVMDPKHRRPDRWPTAAEAARRVLEGGEGND